MVTIKQLNHLEYLFLMGDFRTAYTDLQEHNSLSSKGFLLGLFADGEPAGFLISEMASQNCCRVSHLFVRQDCRRQGFAKMLLEQACLQARNCRSITAGIVETHSWYPQIKGLLEGLDFQADAKVRIFRCQRDDLKQWKAYCRESGDKLCSWLINAGYETVSLAQADSSLINQLYHSPESEYGNTLYIKPFLDGAGTPLCRKLSFLTSKGGRLMAYTLVSRTDSKNVVMEQISVSRQSENRGVILLPFTKMLEAFEAEDFERAAYAMYDTNKDALNFQRKLLRRVTAQEKIQINYIKMLNNGGNTNE